MACYRPLLGLQYYEDGKKIVKVLPNDAWHHMTHYADTRFERYKTMELPCGHCIGCRQSQSKEWSNRLIMESLYHKYTHFLTLTYCDEYLIPVPSENLETGELTVKFTLSKEDFSAFMKRLRKKFGKGIRFYAAGEYGDQTDRPHYHAVIFGLPEEKMKFVPCGKSETGNPYFRCPEIESCWIATAESGRPLGRNAQASKQGLNPSVLGFVSIEPANYFTMKYVTAYVTKKLGARPNQLYELENRVPPFSLSSRRPGIGQQYFLDHPECVEKDKIVVATPQGKVECAVPRYFKKLYMNDSLNDVGVLDELADRHSKAAADRQAAELSQTDLNWNDYLEVKEKNHLAKLKNRNKI